MIKRFKNGQGSATIGLVIFLAGFTFLIYEVSWNRLLSLVLGATVTASTIVLASFMAGFGTGAWFWGRFAATRRGTGHLLAALLGGIGIISATGIYLITHTIPWLYRSLATAGTASDLIELLAYSLAALLLFIPAFLMGGVFPLISKIATSGGESISKTLGRLYAIETLGSAMGGLLTGFFLLGTLGQNSTVILAVAINLALAVWLFLASKFNESPEPFTGDSGLELLADDSKPELPLGDGEALTGKSKAVGHHSKPVDLKALRRAALIGALACGFSILALQVLWLRMFRIYLTNTSYTFALVSSMAILGLFLGSTLFKRRGYSVGDLQGPMLRVLLYLGISAGAGLLLLIYLPEILMFPFQSLLGNPLARVFLLPVVASLLVILPPSLFSGYGFPLACSMYSTGRVRISRDVGLVLMVNTAGSVMGPVLVAFVLLPTLGAVISILLIIALLCVAALYIMFHPRPAAPPRLLRNILLAVVALLMLVVVFRPEIRILPPSFHRFDREVLFYRESVEGTLAVGRDRDTRTQSKYTFVNNSAVIGSTYDAVKVVKMVGHFPFFLGLDCRDVLVIGFGIGVTTSAIASHHEVESIECVELVTGLRDAAVYYRDLNHNVVNDPRLRLIAGDGRHHLQMTGKSYDLISCDPTHPILGSGNLYTRDYFTLCREHLNPGGMVSQYLPLHKLGTEEFLGIIATFHETFPHCTVWLGHYHAVLLGSLEPIRIDFRSWAAEVDALEKDLHFYVDPYHLAATLMFDGEAIGKLGQGSGINTDDRSYTEFFQPSCLDADNLVQNLRFFMDNRIDPATVFQGIDDPDKMERFRSGNQHLTESLFYKLSGDSRRSLMALQMACRVNPEDQEYPFLIKLYF